MNGYRWVSSMMRTNKKKGDAKSGWEVPLYNLFVAGSCNCCCRSCHAACHFLNCSKTTKVRIVWGPRRINAGVQPLKNEAMPSDLYICVMIEIDDIWRSDALAVMIRVLITSTGEQTVVATRPYVSKWLLSLNPCAYSHYTPTASTLDEKWRARPSCIGL